MRPRPPRPRRRPARVLRMAAAAAAPLPLLNIVVRRNMGLDVCGDELPGRNPAVSLELAPALGLGLGAAVLPAPLPCPGLPLSRGVAPVNSGLAVCGASVPTTPAKRPPCGRPPAAQTTQHEPTATGQAHVRVLELRTTQARSEQTTAHLLPASGRKLFDAAAQLALLSHVVCHLCVKGVRPHSVGTSHQPCPVSGATRIRRCQRERGGVPGTQRG